MTLLTDQDGGGGVVETATIPYRVGELEKKSKDHEDRIDDLEKCSDGMKSDLKYWRIILAILVMLAPWFKDIAIKLLGIPLP